MLLPILLPMLLPMFTTRITHITIDVIEFITDVTIENYFTVDVAEGYNGA
jgi:hypothetical protein